MEKLTRKKVREIANGRPVIRSGYEKITPLLRRMEAQGEAVKAGYLVGVHGWNADVWDVGPIVVVEGHKPFGDIELNDYFKRVLENFGGRYSLSESLGAKTELKDWRKALPESLREIPATQRGNHIRDYATLILRDITILKIKFGKDFVYERTFRPIHQVGTGKKGYRPYYSDDYTQDIREAADAFGLKIEEGNDAPRGGQLGKWVKISNR